LKNILTLKPPIMNTTQAFLDALKDDTVKNKFPDATIRTWRSRASRDLLSLDFMVEFLLENGYHLKQIMIWGEPGMNGNIVSIKNGSSASDKGKRKDGKSEMGKKLFGIRKALNKELSGQWFEWCQQEYSIDFPNKRVGMTEAIFAHMTNGRYISKENTRFALKALKEGKRLLDEFEENIRRELENL
jgi:hypothetical protein